MRSRKMPHAVVAVLLLFTAVGSRAQEYSGELRVAGDFAQNRGKPAYRLEVALSATFSPAAGQALMVFAEPSHTLLLANVEASFLGKEDFGGALALMRGPAGRFGHSVSLPFNPMADRRILVLLKDSEGREWILANAVVNLSHFDFSTSFEGDLVISYARYHHCCSGPRCSQMCIDCDTASFTCDLIDCDIQCGGDLSWPPKV